LGRLPLSFAFFASFADKRTGPANRRGHRCRQHGFTLLELIVAVAVFAVVATIAYSGLDLVLRSRSSLEAEASRQRELDLAVLGLERDLRQALARPVRGPYGNEQPAMAGSAVAAEWTLLDLASSRQGVYPDAGRVRYELVDGALWRSRDAVLDRSPRETSRRRRVLDDVERLSFRYVASIRQRLDQWPPRTGITAPERLPRAVEVTLVLADRGEIVRLIELPEAPR
jgi:general secretion pathway protein J